MKRYFLFLIIVFAFPRVSSISWDSRQAGACGELTRLQKRGFLSGCHWRRFGFMIRCVGVCAALQLMELICNALQWVHLYTLEINLALCLDRCNETHCTSRRFSCRSSSRYSVPFGRNRTLVVHITDFSVTELRLIFYLQQAVVPL